MKKVCIVFIIVLLHSFLFGCQQKSYDLPLNQEKDQIVKIELSKYTLRNRVVLCTLDSTEILQFMEKLEGVSCHRYFNDPETDNRYLSVYLYYENGDVDILGTGICDTTSKSKIRKGWYHLDARETWELFSQYVPVESLPPKK